MAQERRGLLCYPSILLSFDNKHKLFPYQMKNLDGLIKYYQERKSDKW